MNGSLGLFGTRPSSSNRDSCALRSRMQSCTLLLGGRPIPVRFSSVFFRASNRYISAIPFTLKQMGRAVGSLRSTPQHALAIRLAHVGTVEGASHSHSCSPAGGQAHAF